MFLALDIGDARIGVAKAAGLDATPAPVGTYKRANGVAERQILALIGQLEIRTLVAGMPLGEHSERTSQCESVERFCRRIEKRAGVAVEYVDEYGSTVEAEERFSEARQGTSRRKAARAREKGVIDALAAVTILERFLNSLRARQS